MATHSHRDDAPDVAARSHVLDEEETVRHPAHTAPTKAHGVHAALGGHDMVGAAKQPPSPGFEKAMAFILPHEGAFARGHEGDERYVVAQHTKGDAGGTTKYGIDQRSHPGLDVAHLTRAQAMAFYQKDWKSHDLDAVPPNLGAAMFDAYVNGGKPVEWMQNALRKEEPGAGVEPSGKLDPATIAAAQHANQGAVIDDFVEQRDARFEALAKKHPNDRRFLDGWKQRDADLRAYLQGDHDAEKPGGSDRG